MFKKEVIGQRRFDTGEVKVQEGRIEEKMFGRVCDVVPAVCMLPNDNVFQTEILV